MRTLRILIASLFVAFLLIPLSIAGAQKVDTLKRVEVTVSAIRGKETTPITQKTLSKDDLNAQWFGQEMSLQLTLTPNVTASADNGAYNSYTYMRLRGLDQTRINMTLNGVPLNEPEDQGAYFSNFVDFTSSTQSVQIQRGVGTSSNGTASYAGSVNFESINPFQTHRGVEYSYNQNVAADWSQTFGSTGVYVRRTVQNVTGYRDNSANRSNSVFLSSLTVQDKATIRITAFRGMSDNDQAYLASPVSELTKNPMHNPLGADETDHFHQQFLSTTYTRALSEKTTGSVTGYWNTLQGHYFVRFDPTTLADFSVMSGWVGALGNWAFVTDRARVDVGVHANHYTRAHFMYLDPATQAYRNSGDKNEESAFGKVDVAVSARLNLVGDVQVRSTAFRYNPDVQAAITPMDIRWTFFNPKVGINFKVNPTTKLYASVGKNSREPTRNDMFAGFDNVDTSNAAFVGPLSRVRPEAVTDFEAGMEQKATWYALAANVYAMEFRNEIAPIGKLSYIGLPLRKNVGASIRRGVELDATIKPWATLSLSNTAAWSYNRIREYTDDATGLSYHNTTPILTPALVSNHAVTWMPSSLFDFTFGGRYVAKSQLDNTNSAFVTPAYFMTMAKADMNVGPLSLMAVLNNLNNVTAYASGYTDGAEPYYFPMASKNLSLWARWNF
jgi:iron complex outermembrane receptor protein